MTSIGTLDSSAGIAAPTSRPGPAAVRGLAVKLLDIVVALWVFSGSIVLFEPSPYELMFLLVLPVAVMAGLGLYRSTLGLLAIMVLFTPFALIAVFQVRNVPITNALIFNLVTVFLLLTSYVLANYVAENTVKRMRLIVGAYTVAAVISAMVGTFAYLGLLPAADLFLRYGRAKAMFNDPNVYGPFLVLPAMFALQRVLLATNSRQILISGAIFMVLFVGVFVSFSRGAWAHLAVSALIVLVLVFILEANGREKVRIMMMSLVGALMLVVALAGLLSIPAVSSLFETRASSQNYDSGETGRFGRQGYAFELALTNPWGLGPGQFSRMRITEEPHNVYVQVLHAYGWGGGFLFYVLIIATIWKGGATILRPSPYRLMAIPVMATFVPVMGESVIIDSDHWRHIYLLIGLVWGISSATGMHDRRVGEQERVLI